MAFEEAAFDEAAAIERFCAARHTGEHFPADFRDRLSFDEAYRIQLGVVARRVAAGERQVGWKVAQTSAAARQAFGFTEPLFGCVMAEGVRRSGHAYAPGALIRPRLEAEVCVRLGRTLAGEVDVTAVRAAIDAIYPALEIIEVRGDISGQKTLAVADNAATKDIVLGEAVAFAQVPDLAGIECRVAVNGALAATGRGADVMGDPLLSVVWLVAKLATFGRRLAPGELVMTGSITRMIELAPGDDVVAELDGIGSVAVRLDG